MHMGFYNYYDIYNNNRMFMDPSSTIGDDLIYPLVYLGQRLRQAGHIVNTIDRDDLDEFDAICFLDLPASGNEYFNKLLHDKFENLYLIILESPIIRPENWNKSNHEPFKKIFTWDDRWVDNEKYFKFFLPNKVPNSIDVNLMAKNKLCTMITSNKYVSHPLELYTERIRAIKWFEKNHPADFDLYGIGWDRYRFTGPLSVLNWHPGIARALNYNYSSYRGSIKSKRDVLNRYKFSICYENVKGIDGYITEKILDCFFAGCVPIYLGAPNITKFIPSENFIDRRDFSTYDELYSYIKNMPDDTYAEYINNISHLISNGGLYSFSAECFADTLMDHICEKV